MTIKAMKPQTAEQRTIMRLLMSYSTAEKKDFYDVFCQARKLSNLLAVYDRGQLLGCLLLNTHKKYIHACCLMKDTVFASEDITGAIEKVLKTRYPEHTVDLDVRTYPIS